MNLPAVAAVGFMVGADIKRRPTKCASSGAPSRLLSNVRGYVLVHDLVNEGLDFGPFSLFAQLENDTKSRNSAGR